MQKKPPHKKGYVCVGVIVGAHGIKGAVRTKSFCENPENIAAYGLLFTLEDATFTPIKAQADAKGAVRLFLKEVTNRNQSESLAKTYLYVPTDAIDVEEDEILEADLIGIPVFLQTEEVGTLRAISYNGAQDILEIQTAEKIVLIPWVEDYANVNVQEEKINLTEDAQAFFEL